MAYAIAHSCQPRVLPDFIPSYVLVAMGPGSPGNLGQSWAGKSNIYCLKLPAGSRSQPHPLLFVALYTAGFLHRASEYTRT